MLERESVYGWTLARHTTAWVARPSSADEIDAVLAEARRRGLSVVPRGAGFSYGDVILNDGGVVLDLRRLNRILKWNPATGIMTAEPGVTFEQALDCCLRDNWVIAAVPGTRHPTLGGALANNVHGKNAWKAGNFGDWVLSFKLLAADGRVHHCSREENRDLFLAAVGGLGLLGVVLEMDLQCKAVPSPYLEIRKWTVPSLDRMLSDFEVLRRADDYHIGWVDCLAPAGACGRGTIHSATFVEAPRGYTRKDSLAYTSPYLAGIVPRAALWRAVKPLFGRRFMRLVNTGKYWLDRATASRRPHVQNFLQFTFLLDTIPNWRELFLPHGYLELEPVVPYDRCERTFRSLIDLTRQYGWPSHLTAIKCHRPDDTLLSYSMDGCSIGIDVPVDPARTGELNGLFHRMNDVVAAAGGRTYLAKDERLTPEHFRVMYPGWTRFAALKARLDPGGLFQSDMYRRLFRGDAAS